MLGLTFAYVARNEANVARNERHAAIALYAAESAVRMVRAWFDDPGAPAVVRFDPAVCDRTARAIDDDGDPSTPAVPQDGAGRPRYKQGVDRDGDGVDDLLEPPYLGDLRDAFAGTEDAPDVRIEVGVSPSTDAWLEGASDALFGDAGDRGTRTRVSRIALFAPPTVGVSGGARRGIATVAVTARVVAATSGTVLAQRTVRAVAYAIPYDAARGPFASASGVAFDRPRAFRWGPMTAAGEVDLPDDLAHVSPSLARDPAPSPRVDLPYGSDDPATFAAWLDAIEGHTVADPWSRVLAADRLVDAPTDDPVPYPFVWDPPDPVSNPLSTAESRANLQQYRRVGTAGIAPAWRYALWKQIARSGRASTRYFVWRDGDTFSEDGRGPARRFREIVDGGTGVFFFDTTDRQPPEDRDGDGEIDNLTPPIAIVGGGWSFRGVLYVHAKTFGWAGVAGRPWTIRAPGEPFADVDRDGVHDPGEAWVNLRYPARLGEPWTVDAADGLRDDGTVGIGTVRNGRGPAWSARSVLAGVLVTHGRFDPAGPADLVHGTVVARGGLAPHTGGRPPVDVYADARFSSLPPPAELGLPRVVLADWSTE